MRDLAQSQVENLEDCISINHNWLNAYSAHWALARLSQVLSHIKTGLGEEAQDANLCEELLEVRVGMGLGVFCDLLEGVIRRRRRPTQQAEAKVSDAPEAAAIRKHSCAQATAVLAEALTLVEAEYEVDELDPERSEAVARQRALIQSEKET